MVGRRRIPYQPRTFHNDRRTFKCIMTCLFFYFCNQSKMILRHFRVSNALRALSRRPPAGFQRPTKRAATTSTLPSLPTRSQSSFIPAPTENAGPLLQRLPNRALPSISRSYTWLKTLPIFTALITISALAIFNYQKSSSSTVNSILYALRTSEQARDLLGDEIYFASKVPWIRGELNQLQGRIDIRFWVKGRKNSGKVRFVSRRQGRGGYVSVLCVP